MSSGLIVADARERIQVSDKRLLDVAICSCNRPQELALLLESVLDLDDNGAHCGVLVIENGARSNEAEDLFRQYANHPRIIFDHDPIAGLSRARNRALNLTTAQWLAFIDDDAIPDRDWLGTLITTIAQFSNAGMIGGRVSPIFTSDRPAWLVDDLLSFLSVVNWGGEARELAEKEWLVGANMTVNVAKTRELGGFDTRLGRGENPAVLLSNEELDLVMKFRRSEETIIWAPEVIVTHRIEPSRLTRDWFRSRAAWQAVSDFYINPDLAYHKAHNLQWDLKRAIFPSVLKSKTFADKWFRRRKPDCDFIAEVRGVYAITVYALAGADPRNLLLDLGKQT